jgi:Holliday junction resolvase
LVRIVLRAANVARDFFVWPSGIHLYDETARHFRGEPIVSSKFQGRKLSLLHVSAEIEEVGNN